MSERNESPAYSVTKSKVTFNQDATVGSLIEINPPISLQGTAFMKAVFGLDQAEIPVTCEELLTTDTSTILYAQAVFIPNFSILRDRIDQLVNNPDMAIEMMNDKPFSEL